MICKKKEVVLQPFEIVSRFSNVSDDLFYRGE